MRLHLFAELGIDEEHGTTISLADAVDQGLVEVRIRGTGAASGSSIILNVRRLEPRFLQITFSPGTVLVSSVGSEQDMVVRRLQGVRIDQQHYTPYKDITLVPDEPIEFLVEAYCLNIHKDNPSPTTTFSLGAPPLLPPFWPYWTRWSRYPLPVKMFWRSSPLSGS